MKKSETDLDTVIKQIEIQMGLELTEEEENSILEVIKNRFLDVE